MNTSMLKKNFNIGLKDWLMVVYQRFSKKWPRSVVTLEDPYNLKLCKTVAEAPHYFCSVDLGWGMRFY
ncbi:hypothetical protein T4D_6507 [Trichinella pseudospiralis]|uniref:Uncharacterized protein n=1 Tax=Trichinella pseudospiralis TaxID=6337 RepID=A0A0V1F7L4_TRIPS|nr:hypothetical protein T4D_6507 [Trichinella pseudospiralis]